MITQNKSEFDKSNITLWHKKGYKGKGATIVVLDSSGMPRDFTNVELPFPNAMIDRNIGKASNLYHSGNVCAVVREVAPKARIVLFPNYSPKQEYVDWIIEHKDEIDVVNCSFSSDMSSTKGVLKQIYDAGLPLICSSGNAGRDRPSKPASFDFTIAIGAKQENTGKVVTYSNRGVDTVAYTNIYIPTEKDYSKTMMFDGTSTSAPVVSAMLAIYIGWRKERGLPKLSPEEIRNFIHKNSMDMYEEGYDDLSGYGHFRLPDSIPEIKEENNMAFKDTKGISSEGAINFLKEKGITNGYPDGTFKPDNPITRAEVAQMIARSMGYVEKK